MFIKAKSIVGVPILTLDDNRKDHEVRDIIYNYVTNEVKAILVDERGWFRGSKVIPIEEVNTLDHDQLTIDSESAIIEFKHDSQDITTSLTDDSNFLTKNEVITQGGNILGRVTDIYFEFPSGKIDAFEVTEDLIQRFSPRTKKIYLRDVITMGENTLIVKNTAQDTLNDPYDTGSYKYEGNQNIKKLSVLDNPGRIHYPNENYHVQITDENQDEQIQVVEIRKRK
jgi:uncharacterized protein YrrD